MQKDRGNGKDQECCEAVSLGDPMVVMYTDLMVQCFEAASVVMEKAELLAEEELAPPKLRRKIAQPLRTRIALPIFDRVTRQMPAQDKIYGLALEYVGLLMKEKEAEMKRSEEATASLSAPPFGGFTPSGKCEHPGLRAIRQALMCEDHLSHEGHEAIDALAVDGIITCPICHKIMSAEVVKSGEVWREPAEEKYQQPEAPSENDMRVFTEALEEVLKNGSASMCVMKRVSATQAPTGVAHDDLLEDREVADVLSDPDFFGTVRKEYGEGVYIFKLWKRDLTLHSDHEFFLGDIQEAEEAEEAGKS